MKAEEIRTQEDLEAWLKDQPQEVCVWIAYRAAARMLPMWWQEVATRKWLPSNDVTTLPACRALLISASVASAENDAGKSAAADAATTAAHASISWQATGHAASAIRAATSAATTAAADEGQSSHAASTIAWAALHSHREAAPAAFADARWVEVEGIKTERPVWPDTEPDFIATAWENTRQSLPDPADDQPDYRSFWVPWYQGLLDGKPAFPDSLTRAVALIDPEDWDKGDLHINNVVIPRLMAEHGVSLAGRGDLPEAERVPRSSRIKVVKAQVSILRDFLDAELETLRAQNDRNPEDEDMLELLKELKSLVEQLVERFERANDDSQVVVAVEENLPAIIETTCELALVEEDPKVSSMITLMAATIKELTDSGADPKLATLIAMGDTAHQKVWGYISKRFKAKKE